MSEQLLQAAAPAVGQASCLPFPGRHDAWPTPPLLSVIIPVYNEERTICEIVDRVVRGPYPYPDKEVIVVDDGSRDRTSPLLERWDGQEGVRVLRHPSNRGKGAAVRTALAHARGSITIIQDADLEYDPDDYPFLVERIRQGTALVVYGSRYLKGSPRQGWSKYRIAVCLLNRLVCWLYGQRLTDEATCYKAFPTDLVRVLDLQAERFELCAELTAKFCRLHIPIAEVAISYRPRTRAEGKKIGWRDAWQTMTTLLRWRFARFRCRQQGALAPPWLDSLQVPEERRVAHGSTFSLGQRRLRLDGADPSRHPRGLECQPAQPDGR